MNRSPLPTYPPSRLGETPDGGPMRPALQPYVEYHDRTNVREQENFFFVPQPEPYGPSLDQEDGLLTSFGVTESMSEGTDPRLGQPQGLSYSTSGPPSYEPGAQDFPPQHSTYSEWQSLSGSSARHDQPPPPLTVQDRQNKVQCSRPGCIAVVNKNNLTRHVNEVHERKVKARCHRCGKGFARPYMRDEHIRRVRCGSI